MPNYLCRPAELNSSSPVLPEGAHSLEHNSALNCLEDSENLRGWGEKRERGMGGEGGNREREGEREKERVKERELERKREEVHVNTKVNYMDIHVHSRIIRHACYLYGYGRG